MHTKEKENPTDHFDHISLNSPNRLDQMIAGHVATIFFNAEQPFGWIVERNDGICKFFIGHKPISARGYARGFGEDCVLSIFPVFKKAV